MINCFKLWLESESLDAFIKSNELARANYKYLLQDKNIQKIVSDIDRNNLILHKKKDDKGILLYGNHRIPIVVRNVTQNQTEVEKLDGTDFSELINSWPIFPDPNKKSIVLLPSRIKIAANDNGLNFVKLLSKVLAEKNIGYGSEQYDEFMDKIKPIMPYLSVDPNKLQNLIDKGDSKIQLEKFPLKTREMIDIYNTALDWEQIDYVENFENGLSWITNLYGNQDALHLVDKNHRIYMVLYRNSDREIVDHDYNSNIEQDNLVLKPYLTKILMNKDEIHGDESLNIFPGFGFDNDEILKIIKANPNLRPSNKLMFLMLQMLKGDEEKQKAYDDLYQMAPLLKNANIQDADYSNLCLRTDIKGEAEFRLKNFMDEYLNGQKSRLDTSSFYTNMMDAPPDIIKMIITIHAKILEMENLQTPRKHQMILSDLEENRYLIDGLLEDIVDDLPRHLRQYWHTSLLQIYKTTMKNSITKDFKKGFILSGPICDVFVQTNDPFRISYNVVIPVAKLDSIIDSNFQDYKDMLEIFQNDDLEEKKKYVVASQLYYALGTKNGIDFYVEDMDQKFSENEISLTEYYAVVREFLNEFWHKLHD